MLTRTLHALARACQPSRLLLATGLALLVQAGQAGAVEVVVKPNASPLGLKNPLKGFRITDLVQAQGSPYATTFRKYVEWNVLEDGEIPDDATAIKRIQQFFDTGKNFKDAADSGFRFTARIYLVWPGKDGNPDRTYWPKGIDKWDFFSPNFVNRMKNLVRRCGLALKDDPRLGSFEIGIHGLWGEHHMSQYWDKCPNQDTRNGVPNALEPIYNTAFENAFPDIPVMRRYPKDFVGSRFGYYLDSFAHPTALKEQTEIVTKDGSGWKTGLVTGEVSYRDPAKSVMGVDENANLSNPKFYNYTKNYIHWLHTTSLGIEYDSSNATAQGAAVLQDAFGWKFAVNEVRFSSSVAPGSDFELQLNVRNVGSAPFYAGWPVGVALLDPTTLAPVWRSVMPTADTKTWMPGNNYDLAKGVYTVPAVDNLVKAHLPVPSDLAKGEYLLSIGLLDPAGMQPNGRFAIANFVANGWQPIGRIGVGKEPASQALPNFTNLNAKSLSYPFSRASIARVTNPLTANPAVADRGQTTMSVSAVAPDGGALSVTYLVFGPGEAKLSTNHAPISTPVTITFPKVGDYTVQAYIVNAKNGQSVRRSQAVKVTSLSSVTVPDLPPTIAQAAAAAPSIVNGATTTLSVLGADDAGEGKLTYAWSTTGTVPAAVVFSANTSNAAKATQATFSKAGSYPLQVSVSDNAGQKATSAVTVTVSPTATSMTTAPAVTTIATGASQAFTATVKDQFGDALAAQPAVTWVLASGVGQLTAQGVYTAPSSGTGTATIKATVPNSDVPAKTFTLRLTAPDVGDAPPTVSQAAAAAPAQVTGKTTRLSVLGADDGGEGSLVYGWATTGTVPDDVTFSANDKNAAKATEVTFSKAGTYNFRATITDDADQTAVSSVPVTVAATPSAITLVPDLAVIANGASQEFLATVVDQFGDDLEEQPQVTWSVVNGGGTITSAGVYTAPTTGVGTATIRARYAVNGGAILTEDHVVAIVAKDLSQNDVVQAIDKQTQGGGCGLGSGLAILGLALSFLGRRLRK